MSSTPNVNAATIRRSCQEAGLSDEETRKKLAELDAATTDEGRMKVLQSVGNKHGGVKYHIKAQGIPGHK